MLNLSVVLVIPPGSTYEISKVCCVQSATRTLCIDSDNSWDINIFINSLPCFDTYRIHGWAWKLGSRLNDMSQPLPKPNYAFNIPSIHDDLELDCRLYYPRRTEQNSGIFGKAFTIFAHPYATLGGTYDDPVVALAGGILLRYGCTLITFNFR